MKIFNSFPLYPKNTLQRTTPLQQTVFEDCFVSSSLHFAGKKSPEEDKKNEIIRNCWVESQKRQVLLPALEKLLSAGEPRFQEPDERDKLRLLKFVEKNNREMVETLLRQGVSASTKVEIDGVEWTLLRVAAAKGHWEMMEYLLETPRCASLDYEDLWLLPALLGSHEPEVLTRLVQQTESERKSGYPSYLVSAVWRNDIGMINLMLAHGADVNGQDRTADDQTPLGEAIAQNNIAVAQLLIEKGARVNPQEDEEVLYSPLEQAVEQDSLDMVKLLLDHGAAIDGPHKSPSRENTVSSETPLMMAVRKKNVEMVELLLQYKPNLKLKYRDHFPTQGTPYVTALEMAMESGNKEIENLLRQAGAKY